MLKVTINLFFKKLKSNIINNTNVITEICYLHFQHFFFNVAIFNCKINAKCLIKTVMTKKVLSLYLDFFYFKCSQILVALIITHFYLAVKT